MQALGRCIRHRADFGAIILLDERLRSVHIQKHLSRWLRGQIRESRSTHEACTHLSSFFASCQKLAEKKKQQYQIDQSKTKQPLVDDAFKEAACSKTANVRQRWADGGQRTIAQMFCAKQSMKRKESENAFPVELPRSEIVQVKHEGCCAVGDRCTCSTQPCGEQFASALVTGSPVLALVHPSARPTQPEESLSFNMWAQHPVNTRAFPVKQERCPETADQDACCTQHCSEQCASAFGAGSPVHEGVHASARSTQPAEIIRFNTRAQRPVNTQAVQVKHEGCAIAELCTRPTQPFGGPWASASVAGSVLEAVRPSARPAQPTESTSIETWAQRPVITRALQLLPASQSHAVEAADARGEGVEGGNAPFTSQCANDSTVHVTKCEAGVCCNSPGKRWREEQTCVAPERTAATVYAGGAYVGYQPLPSQYPATACIGGAQAETQTMLTQSPSGAAKGGMCCIRPADAELLLSGFLDDEIDGDDNDEPAKDHAQNEIIAGTHRLGQPCCPSQQRPTSDEATKIYGPPRRQAHANPSHIQAAGQIAAVLRPGHDLRQLAVGYPAHSKQVPTPCQGTIAHHPLHTGQQCVVRLGQAGPEICSSVGDGVDQGPLNQGRQSIWNTACAQWCHIDVMSLSHSVRTTSQTGGVASAANEHVSWQASHHLMNALATAQQHHQQGQLVHFLGDCAVIPCGLAFVLRYAQMEPGHPTCTDAAAALLCHSMRLWTPDECTLTAIQHVLSCWHVGHALRRLAHNYASLLPHFGVKQQ